jgi:UDP-3-O-[3-hydroxymyristoyl] glucosamine N-acyltransferase
MPISSVDLAGGYRDQTAIVGHPPEARDWPRDRPGVQPFIAPTARIEAFVTVDAGKERATTVGAHSWLLKHSHVGHDAIIEDRVEISTGAVIGGYAHIQDGARVGLGAVVGAGAVVTKDVPAGETWAGNPARKLEPGDRDPRPHTERASVYEYNPQCLCKWCKNHGQVPVGTPDNGHAFGYEQPHIPPRSAAA